MDDDKPQKLKAFLEGLPERIVRQLTAAVERDQVSGGKDLPHGMLLEGLRPTLTAAESRVNRTPTPMRLFCMPFEDLLVGKRTVKRTGHIARSSLMPIWEWLAAEVMPALFREHYDRLTTAILENDTVGMRHVADELHAAGAAAIARALEAAPEGSSRRKEIAQSLGGEDAVKDAEDISRVLEAAPEILDLREVFPAPVKSLTPKLLNELRSHYDLLAEHMPDSARYLVVVAMCRLSRPWEILRAGVVLSRQNSDSLLSRTDLSLIGDLLFGDLEDVISYFRAQDARHFDPDEALYQLTKFARMSQGIADELESLKDATWARRISEIRKDASAVFERLIEHVPDQIRHAMPFRVSGAYAARSSHRPDMRNAPNPGTLQRALKLATFMRETRPLASSAAISATHSDAYDIILHNLNAYRDGLLSELRSCEDRELLSRARAYLDLTVELTAVLVSEGEAQIFRRKGALAERNDHAATG